MFNARHGWVVGWRRKPPVRLVYVRPRLGSAPPRETFLAKLSRRWRRIRMPVLFLSAAAIIYGGLILNSPWDQLTTLKHFAAMPNCDAARAVGLAPAREGAPGYWARHDRDLDGKACEAWPRQR